MTYYRRHLPHWHPQGMALFVTWRLRGSLPGGLQRKFSKEATAAIIQIDGVPSRRVAAPSHAGKRFRALDCQLDKAGFGPVWLKDTRVAQGVVETLRFGANHLNLYELLAYVVMANHVHVLLRPSVPLARITRLIKGFTARKANRILGRMGHAFWQDESFDHWVRNEAELVRIISYIERNPVTAGLVQKAEDWPWSSASRTE